METIFIIAAIAGVVVLFVWVNFIVPKRAEKDKCDLQIKQSKNMSASKEHIATEPKRSNDSEHDVNLQDDLYQDEDWFEELEEKPMNAEQAVSHAGRTTQTGYTNANNQTNKGCLHKPGTHPNQTAYAMHCNVCGFDYEANGCDIKIRKCPRCQ